MSRHALSALIRAAARTDDGRGHWRQYRSCVAALIEDGASPLMAERCAQAAMSVGERIRECSSLPAFGPVLPAGQDDGGRFSLRTSA